eukprot:scaffold2682_cov344-Pavlova_lutheri.AAC.17
MQCKPLHVKYALTEMTPPLRSQLATWCLSLPLPFGPLGQDCKHRDGSRNGHAQIHQESKICIEGLRRAPHWYRKGRDASRSVCVGQGVAA